MIGRPVVVFELHGIDLADASEDDLTWLAPHQPDLGRSAEQKRRAISAALAVLEENGYEFVTTERAAQAFRDAAS